MNEHSWYFGQFGGRYVADTLMRPLAELEEAFNHYWNDADYQDELARARHQFIGRPTPLFHAQRLSDELGGAMLYLKLEGLANSGAHKINNALGQALLAKRLGKSRIIAETGAGQHGVATAAACAQCGLECVVYMGAVDMHRQQPNVLRMRLFGADVRPVRSGAQTLKDAVNAALRDWADSFPTTHYLLGSAVGPSPFPRIVATLQAIIGEETAQQCRALNITPHYCIACAGGGSNALGFFAPWLNEQQPVLIAVEAGGLGDAIGEHAQRIALHAPIGIAQGYKSYFLQDNDGQIMPTHSISAGLDYPGIGPQLAALAANKRVQFVAVRDRDALHALRRTARATGALPALESAHALAHAYDIAPHLSPQTNIIVNVSGSGDKDLFIIAKENAGAAWGDFLEQEYRSIHGREDAAGEK